MIVTVRGAGADASVLDFTGQQGAGEGLLVTGSMVVLEDFAVENTRGDGIKSKGSDQITFRRLRVEWTDGPDAGNGAYGLYPVESKNVLIEDSLFMGDPQYPMKFHKQKLWLHRASMKRYEQMLQATKDIIDCGVKQVE